MYQFSASLFLLLLLSCSGNSQNENATTTGLSTPAEVEEQRAEEPAIADTEFADAIVDELFQDYLHLRTALVNSDADEAAKVAGDMMPSLKGERPEIEQVVERIANTDDLSVQRIAFSELTDQIQPLFEAGMSGGTFYKIHCPMAFEGVGADWLSEVSEVKNPYYGDAMLSCGKVTEEFTK